MRDALVGGCLALIAANFMALRALSRDVEEHPTSAEPREPAE